MASSSIPPASRRRVRVDSLDSSYWSLSYMEAKRVLEPGYKDAPDEQAPNLKFYFKYCV